MALPQLLIDILQTVFIDILPPLGAQYATWQYVVYYVLLPICMLVDSIFYICSITIPLVPTLFTWLVYSGNLDLGGYTQTHTHIHTSTTFNYSSDVRSEECSWSNSTWFQTPTLTCNSTLHYTWREAVRRSWIAITWSHSTALVATAFDITSNILALASYSLALIAKFFRYIR